MFQKFLITFIVFFLLQTSYIIAQKQGQALVDSLLLVLPSSKEDTAKVNLLNELTYLYRTINNNEGIKYGKQSCVLAKQLKWNKGIAVALNNLALNYLTIAKDDSAKISLLASLDINVGETDSLVFGQSKRIQGEMYIHLSEHEKAMECFEQARGISIRLKNRELEGFSFLGMGGIYWVISDYTKALEYYQQAYKIAESTNNKWMLARTMVEMGNVFYYFDTKKAILNYEKAITVYAAYGDITEQNAILYNLGLIYADSGNYKLAMEYCDRSLGISQYANFKFGKGTTYGVIGYIYDCQHDYTNALFYYKKALETDMETGSARQTIDDLLGIAGVYKNAPEPVLKEMNLTSEAALNKAVEYGLRAIEVGRKSSALDQLNAAYKAISETYEKQQRNDKALDAYKQYITIRDSSLSIAKQKDITRKDMQFEFDKKQLADSLSNSEIKRAAAFKLQKQKVYSYTSLAGIAVLLLSTLLVFRYYRKQKNLNNELSHTLEELTATQHQLVKSEKMAAFGSIASRLAHEIQNPLNFVNNFSDLSEELVQEIMTLDNKDEREEAAKILISNLQKINYHGKRADSIIKDLQKHSRDGTAHDYFEKG
ncbi:MAG: tetratricopeptide repeat protein [Ferruginibacter sp.]